MNTPAHLLMAAAIWSKPKDRVRNSAALFGAFLPDLSLFWMVFWERNINGESLSTIFDELYFSEFWQEIFAISNAIPLFLALALLGVVLKRDWIWILALAAALHCLLDLPLHHDDGRPHFWPLSDWIYESPLSYWDPRHFGTIIGPIEALIGVGFGVVLWRRFKKWPARTAILLAVIVEVSIGGVAPMLFEFG